MSAAQVPEFQDRIVGVLTAVGVPRMAARVLMALMASDGALTAAEIAEHLDISAAAVSGTVRYLQRLGFVARISVSGSRRDRYGIVLDAWYSATMTNGAGYQQVADAAANGAASLPAGSPAQLRLAEMSDFFLFIQERIRELMHEWEGRRQTKP